MTVGPKYFVAGRRRMVSGWSRQTIGPVILSITLSACGGAGTKGTGLLTGTAPPCPGPSGISRGAAKLRLSGPDGYHHTALLLSPYHFRFSLPVGEYHLADISGVTHASATVRRDATTKIDLGSSCG